MSLTGHRLEAATHVMRAATCELQRLLEEMAAETDTAAGVDQVSHENVADLSERQLEVLSLMAQGYSNLAIARRLCVMEKTVEAHVSSIFSILELPPSRNHSRRVLAVLAYRQSRL